MKYSIIVPVYNEEENVASLHAEITATMQRLNEPFEIIFADDGSSDSTVKQLQTLSPVTIIELRKNFGQTAAMDAGIKHATGEFIITMDGDGQNPPTEIPKLIEKMQEGDYDIVSGWRRKRNDPFFKKFISRGAHTLRSIFVKDHIHDSGCSLKLYRRTCFENVDLFGEMHRFIPAVLSWSGYTISEVEVEHRSRKHGETKYSWKRIVKGFIDMLAVWFWRKYAHRPLHLFGSIGLLLISIGGVLFLYLGVIKFFMHISIADSNIPLLAVLLMILGVQFFISGLLADIAIRQYYSNGRRPYSIRKVTEIDSK
ncbi:glycosyltransferase family 2 protein [Patescibacteria group bacterium]